MKLPAPCLEEHTAAHRAKGDRLEVIPDIQSLAVEVVEEDVEIAHAVK